MPRGGRLWLSSAVACVCFALLIVGAGCAEVSQRSVVEVTLGRAAQPSLQEASDPRTILSSVAWVLVERLGLPLSSPLHAYFYSTAEAFELGLVTDARSETWFAKDQARFASGVGTYYGILLREDKFRAASLLARVGLVAHELTHVSQYELAGGRRGGSEQWLREGHADWVRFRVLEHFGLRSYAESKSRILQSVRRAHRENFPLLTLLATNREWTTARNEHGQVPTYFQAFLATDWLVERRGHVAVVEYFRRFGRFDDRGGNFEAAFGMSLSRFADEFQSRLRSSL